MHAPNFKCHWTRILLIQLDPYTVVCISDMSGLCGSAFLLSLQVECLYSACASKPRASWSLSSEIRTERNYTTLTGQKHQSTLDAPDENNTVEIVGWFLKIAIHGQLLVLSWDTMFSRVRSLPLSCQWFYQAQESLSESAESSELSLFRVQSPCCSNPNVLLQLSTVTWMRIKMLVASSGPKWISFPDIKQPASGGGAFAAPGKRDPMIIGCHWFSSSGVSFWRTYWQENHLINNTKNAILS